MTISTVINRKAFTGDGSSLDFVFPYKFLLNEDLDVYLNGTLKTITTHYTVTGAGLDAGGTVSFLVAPALNDDVVIVRNPALTQGLDLVENDPLPAESLENALDKTAMIVQKLSDTISRSAALADSDVSGADVTLPTPVADEIIKWNSYGTALEGAAIAEIGAVTIPIPVSQGGTGSTTAANARIALGLEIGVDVEAYDATILKDADIGVSVQAYDADTAKLDVAQTWPASQRSGVVTDNDASFDLSGLGNNYNSTPTAAFEIAFTNIASNTGKSGYLTIINGSNYIATAHADTKITTTDLTMLSGTGTYVAPYLCDGTNVNILGVWKQP